MPDVETTLVLDGELSLDSAKAEAKRVVLKGEKQGVVTVTDGQRTLYQCWGDGADFYELQYEIENSRRRTARVPRLVPIEIGSGDVAHGARTADVSASGALVLSTSLYPPDARVTVRNLENGEIASFRVVWIAAHEADALWAFKLGLELDDPAQVSMWAAAPAASHARDV
jgi:hypothetical protein